MSSSATNENVNAVDKYGETALHRAAVKADVKEVERLLASGADVDARTRGDRSTPLHFGSNHGDLEIVRALLRHGADIDACDYYGSFRLFVRLDSHAFLFSLRRSCLYSATLGRNFEVVEFLLYKGASVSIVTNYG